MERRPLSEHLKTVGQVLGIILLLAYFFLLLHKGAVDMRALAQAHPGDQFWPALGRHVLRILGGG